MLEQTVPVAAPSLLSLSMNSSLNSLAQQLKFVEITSQFFEY